MTWQEILNYIVMPILVVLVIPVTIALGRWVYNRFEKHGAIIAAHDKRLDHLETGQAAVAADVKETKADVKTLTAENRKQTRMLDRMLGKMGLGLEGLDGTGKEE